MSAFRSSKLAREETVGWVVEATRDKGGIERAIDVLRTNFSVGVNMYSEKVTSY